MVFGPKEKLEIAKLVDGLGFGRIEAGFPQSVGRRPRSHPGHRERRPERRNLGVRPGHDARRRGRCGTWPQVHDHRIPDLRRQARGARHVACQALGARQECRELRRRQGHLRHLLRRRLHPGQSRLLRRGLPDRARSRSKGNRGCRHDRHRHSRGSDLPDQPHQVLGRRYADPLPWPQ